MISIIEIFHSLQGETTKAGFPTVFIRMAGCNLRCVYCDTQYAWEEGIQMAIDEIVKTVESFHCKLVEITGGEPLEQPELPDLCEKLLSKGFSILLETNGTLDISKIPQKVVKAIDIKCPGSNESGKFLYDNLKHLSPKDELKFVISSKEDFIWAISEIEKHDLLSICTINISPVAGVLNNAEVARWIIDSGKNLRLNLQLHKIIEIK
ncbi:MAG: radical SAM protein [Nitrospinae bacterium]|nr:radical SAM protein [Nitrospinota bacterium]